MSHCSLFSLNAVSRAFSNSFFPLEGRPYSLHHAESVFTVWPSLVTVDVVRGGEGLEAKRDTYITRGAGSRTPLTSFPGNMSWRGAAFASAVAARSLAKSFAI